MKTGLKISGASHYGKRGDVAFSNVPVAAGRHSHRPDQQLMFADFYQLFELALAEEEGVDF